MSSEQEFLEARIGDIPVLDRLRIMEEVNRYAWAWDSGDIEEYLSCYAPDGALEHPTPDGKPGYHTGHEQIRAAIQANMDGRPTNSYALQHHFGSPRLQRRGDDVMVNAYCVVLRHEFHRTYWPHGPSFRMGTWHALYSQCDGDWRIKVLSVKMWTDTAFNSGVAIQHREPGMVGTGTPFG